MLVLGVNKRFFTRPDDNEIQHKILYNEGQDQRSGKQLNLRIVDCPHKPLRIPSKSV